MKALLPILFVLVGCATATPYQKANYLGYGYRSTNIDNQTARVSFKGNRLTERTDVELMLLYRAAEVTKENNFKYFTLVRMETDKSHRTDFVTVPYYSARRNGHPRFRANIWWNHPIGAPNEYNLFEAVSFIKMTEKPMGNESMNAEETLRNLSPQIKRK